MIPGKKGGETLPVGAQGGPRHHWLWFGCNRDVIMAAARGHGVVGDPEVCPTTKRMECKGRHAVMCGR